MGGHLEFGNGRIGRLDGIFVHEVLGIDRLFVKLTELAYTGNRDEILDLPLVELGEEVIIGLPAITAKRLYVIDLRDTTVLVDWSVQFL